MKSVAYILLAIVSVGVSILLGLLVKYFFMSEKIATEGKFAVALIGGIVFTPLIGRIVHVLKNKN